MNLSPVSLIECEECQYEEALITLRHRLIWDALQSDPGVTSMPAQSGVFQNQT